MNNRSYHQFCALAYALDAIGERWSLLIIRELLTGPRRFKDLLEGLPGISTNLLSERLKSLEGQAILLRRTLPPPAGSTVYELTPFGRSLEPAIVELGKWGSRLLPPTLDGEALPSVGTAELAIKAFFRPERAHGVHETYQLNIGCEVLQVHVDDGLLDIRPGEASKPAMVLHTNMKAYMGLFSGQIPPTQALTAGLAQLEGDPAALERFLAVCGVGSPV